MGLGFDAKINGKMYKFSFAKPNPTAPELEHSALDQFFALSDPGSIAEAIKSLSNLKSDKAMMKKWKEILNN